MGKSGVVTHTLVVGAILVGGTPHIARAGGAGAGTANATLTFGTSVTTGTAIAAVRGGVNHNTALPAVVWIGLKIYALWPAGQVAKSGRSGTDASALLAKLTVGASNPVRDPAVASAICAALAAFTRSIARPAVT